MGKKRTKVPKHVGPPANDVSRDSDSDADSTTSEATHMSVDSVCTEGPTIGDEEMDTSDEARVKFENHLAENIENATHKTTAVRLGALKNLQALLSRHILPDAIIKWRSSLCDVVEKSVKKGSVAEATAAVRLLALATVQLGVDIGDDGLKLIAVLSTIVTNEAVDIMYRGVCCAPTIALCTYAAVDELHTLQASIAALRTMWSSVKSGNVVAEMGDPFESAVHAYGLLLCQLPNSHLLDVLKTDVSKLTAYLHSNQVQIRISAGDTLALLYELAIELHNEPDWRAANHEQIADRLDALQNDSLKFHAKRDRRVQRATFREIAAYFKTRECPSVTYKFGVGERVILRSWQSKLCYDTHCAVLTSAMNAHLQKNQLLRDMFDLGAPVVVSSVKDVYGEKADRLAIHAAADKARSQHRDKQRSKRLASFSEQ